MTGVSNVYSLGNNGEYGFFVIHKGYLIYTDPEKEPQIEIPIRILQDILLETDDSADSTSRMQFVFNFEIGFEIDLPNTIAQKSKIWILSILGMSNSTYTTLEREKQSAGSPPKEPSRVYTIVIAIVIIGFLIGVILFFLKPLLFSSVQRNFVKQDHSLAMDYQKKGIEEEEKGHITSAVSFFEQALMHDQSDQSIREDLDRVLEKRIEQNINVGNFIRAKQDLYKLSKDNKNQKMYAERLKTASQNHTLKLSDVSEIVRLFFRSAFSKDPVLHQELNDKLQLFGKKLEFVLQ
ncbi:MAG: hypothetical protein PHI40_04130 [Caldisericia bacterium]|nr:hypothetical protein [Caldisericia bacterium]MDD4614583.1 hypothetical protein [Caldisericia bacterium]